jgi:hypothetical protein
MKIKLKKREVEEETEEVMAKAEDNAVEEDDVEEAAPSSKAWFAQGFKHAKKEAAKAKARGSWTPEFWLKNGEEAEVRFLSDQPFCIYTHRVKIGNRFAERTCLEDTGSKCPLCESGNKRRFVGCFSIIDRRKESWTNKEGKLIKKENTLKLWRCGQRILGQLDNLIAKRGSLLGYDVSVSRAGEGKDSVYNFIPEQPSALSVDDRGKKPLDLVKLLSPKTRPELLAEMGSSTEDEEEVVESF